MARNCSPKMRCDQLVFEKMSFHNLCVEIKQTCCESLLTTRMDICENNSDDTCITPFLGTYVYPCKSVEYYFLDKFKIDNDLRNSSMFYFKYAEHNYWFNIRLSGSLKQINNETEIENITTERRNTYNIKKEYRKIYQYTNRITNRDTIDFLSWFFSIPYLQIFDDVVGASYEVEISNITIERSEGWEPEYYTFTAELIEKTWSAYDNTTYKTKYKRTDYREFF